MIYIKTKNKLDSVGSIIKELYNDIYESNSNEFLDITVNAVETYKNEKYTEIECRKGRWRSIDALIEICKTYLPNITEKEIFTELFNTQLIYEGNVLYIHLVNCYEIKKPTFYFSNFFNKIEIDDSKFDCNLSPWTWGKVIKEAGFNSITELSNHIKSL